MRDTVVKVPLLGDIPLVGNLFKRSNKVNNKSKLYVFLTPRIMSDPNFNDLKLFSQGPQSDMQVDDNSPDMEPALIDAPSAMRYNSTLPPMRSREPIEDLQEESGMDQPRSTVPAMKAEQIEITEVDDS